MIKINAEVIAKFNPCSDRFHNFKAAYPTFSGSVAEFASLDDITYKDKVWVLTRLMTQKQKFQFALACAESVYSLFADKYPADLRIRVLLNRLALVNDPVDLALVDLGEIIQLRNAAVDAAYAAYAAYGAYADADANAAHAAAHAAADAAYAAAYAAASADAASAAYAADAAAAAAAYAAYAAASAAASAAAYAADAASAAAQISQQEINLLFLAMILEPK